MSEHSKLTMRKRKLLLRRTGKMYKAGKTPEQIAERLGRPIEEVNYWICLVRQADKIRAQMNG